MKEKKRVATSGEAIVWTSPFAVLKDVAVPPAPEVKSGAALRDVPPIAPTKNRGRVDIIRQTAHRGGKTVTVVKGLTGIGRPEQETLAKKMQKACGTGGHSERGTNRNTGRPTRGSRTHLDRCGVQACVCRRVTGLARIVHDGASQFWRATSGTRVRCEPCLCLSRLSRQSRAPRFH